MARKCEDTWMSVLETKTLLLLLFCYYYYYMKNENESENQVIQIIINTVQFINITVVTYQPYHISDDIYMFFYIKEIPLRATFRPKLNESFETDLTPKT
jgi:hypothetical protein